MDTKQEKGTQNRWRAMFAIAAAQFVDFGESGALSSLFPSIQQSLGLTVGHLGNIAGGRRILGVIFTPVWGMIADRYSRKSVLIWGTGIWGLWTVLIGFSQTYQQILVLSIISGIGLVALQGPLNSLLSDMFNEEERGKAFGIIRTISFIGSVIAVLLFGMLADIEGNGWRIAYWIFGGLSSISGLLIWIYVEEPVRGQMEKSVTSQDGQAAPESEFELKQVPELFKIPTMLVVLLEYIPNTFIFIIAVNFIVTWLVEDRNYALGSATTTFVMLILGLAIGTVTGGAIGDWTEKNKIPNGRIYVGQSALLLSAIVAYLLFQIEWQSGAMYSLLIFLLGFFIDIRYSGALAPMISAVLLPEVRSTGFALVQTMYALAAAAASFLVGQLGEDAGLTQAFFWYGNLAIAIDVLVWFIFYKTYQADANHVQNLLAERA